MRLSRQHVRLAARSFSRNPGFSLVAVLSLALAIALNTTMYSVIDALVNPKLEVTDPDRLYWLTIWGDYRQRVDERTRAALLRDGFNTYEGITLYRGPSGTSRQVAIEHGRHYAQGSVAVVAPNFFTVLGARPISGRAFVDGDLNAESQPVVITDALAASLFPNESPIGQLIDIDGNPTSVIGVVSRAAHLPERSADVFRLLPPGTPLSSIQSNVVRLPKGTPVEVADKQLHVLSARFAAQLGVQPNDVWFQLSAMKRPQFRFRNFHWALIAAVVAVLLVACANLANLQLARGIGRSRELAVRAALGASRADIVTQLVLESAMLAGAGLILGTVLTFWGVGLLSSRVPPSVSSYITAPETNWRVLVRSRPTRVKAQPTSALAPQVNGVSSRPSVSITGKSQRISAVARSRAIALGITSPKTSMIGVRDAVTRIAAVPPTTGSRAQVATDDAVMWAMVTPIIAVESRRSGLRNASR